jgi:arylsulfatase A-like enzyme
MLCAWGPLLPRAWCQAGGKPNLLIIMPDEWRRSAAGFWSQAKYKDALMGKGDPVHTPNVDKFADEAIVFTQATPVHPVCSPARGMILTGTFPERNGLHNNAFQGRDESLKPEIPAITDVLQKEGYHTALFGKAHWIKPMPFFDAEGNYTGSQAAPGGRYVNNYDTYVPPGPDRHGIEYWLQGVKDIHFDPRMFSTDPAAVGGKRDGQVHRPGIYSVRNEADYLVQYLKNTRRQRDGAKPFCAIWTPNPPHSPYGSMADVEADVYNAYYRDKPIDALLTRPNANAAVSGDAVRYYFSNVTSVDKYIGEVLSALDQQGLTQNTIVLITSDHGEMMGSHGRMEKNVAFEEALGVPFLIRYPGKLKPRLENLLMGHTDVMPTLLALMGLADKTPKVDGSDFSRLLMDPQAAGVARPRSSLYLGATPGIRGVRTDKYTFTIDSTGKTLSLFNNASDPYQQRPLVFQSLPAADQLLLREELGYWLRRSNDKWYQKRLLRDFLVYPGATGLADGVLPGKSPGISHSFRQRGSFAVEAYIRDGGLYRLRILNVTGQIKLPHGPM